MAEAKLSATCGQHGRPVCMQLILLVWTIQDEWRLALSTCCRGLLRAVISSSRSRSDRQARFHQRSLSVAGVSLTSHQGSMAVECISIRHDRANDGQAAEPSGGGRAKPQL